MAARFDEPLEILARVQPYIRQHKNILIHAPTEGVF